MTPAPAPQLETAAASSAAAKPRSKPLLESPAPAPPKAAEAEEAAAKASSTKAASSSADADVEMEEEAAAEETGEKEEEEEAAEEEEAEEEAEEKAEEEEEEEGDDDGKAPSKTLSLKQQPAKTSSGKKVVGATAAAVAYHKYEVEKAATWKKGDPVPYLFLARVFGRIEAQSKRLLITEMMANAFRTIIATRCARSFPARTSPALTLAESRRRVSPPRHLLARLT